MNLDTTLDESTGSGSTLLIVTAFSTHWHHYIVLRLCHTGKFIFGNGAVFFGVMLVNCVKALIHSDAFTVPVTQYCMFLGIGVCCMLRFCITVYIASCKNTSNDAI